MEKRALTRSSWLYAGCEADEELVEGSRNDLMGSNRCSCYVIEPDASVELIETSLQY